MASNSTTIVDEAGEYDDWVEVHNFGSTDLSLAGLYLSDNPDLPTKWAFPDLTIAAGEFLLIWADDDEEQGPLHTSYKLDADGEFIGIFDRDENGNTLIDGVAFGSQETDTALGRLPNGTGAIQAVLPTPGATNQPLSLSESALGQLAFTTFPNPVQEHLTIQAPRSGNFRAWLMDARGQLVEAAEWTTAHLDW
jgi:hypothetical protein